jgi:hypothetical protein
MIYYVLSDRFRIVVCRLVSRYRCLLDPTIVVLFACCRKLSSLLNPLCLSVASGVTDGIDASLDVLLLACPVKRCLVKSMHSVKNDLGLLGRTKIRSSRNSRICNVPVSAFAKSTTTMEPQASAVRRRHTYIALIPSSATPRNTNNWRDIRPYAALPLRLIR